MRADHDEKDRSKYELREGILPVRLDCHFQILIHTPAMRRPVSIALLILPFAHLFSQDLGPAKTDPSVPRDPETLLRIQIFLDRQNFCPGKVDGALGEFTYKGVVNYNYARGRTDLYDWQPVIEESQRTVPVLYAAFKITGNLFDYVDETLPQKPEQQAAYEYMFYRSMAELVAERFHTDETFLARINPGRNTNALKPGDVLYVPNVRAFRIEDVPQAKGYKTDAALSRNTVVIDTRERMAAVYDPREKMLATFPITPGKPQFIPVGDWKVTSMVTMPNFRWDKKFLEEGQRGDQAYQIPPGPNSPVGVIWTGISKSGIGLHGTASPRTIGRSQSAGCVRFANWDAIKLPTLIRPGSKVIVR
jgi:lipoprotein-anchoring transpeptidase ErfK/SrfK